MRKYIFVLLTVFCFPVFGQDVFIASFRGTAPSSLLTGLVSYWNFNETSGDLLDIVGSHPGTLGASTASPTQGASGIIGTAYTFDGSNDIITLASPITTGTTFSLSFWLKPNTQSGYGTILTDNGGLSGVWYIGTGNKIDFYSGTDHLNTTGLTNAQWNHMVITCNAGVIGIYINGQSDIITFTTFGGYSANSIGRHTTYEALKGNLDEMGFWSRVLTSAEVTTLYNSGAGKAYPF
jgi:hypothetical protein